MKRTLTAASAAVLALAVAAGPVLALPPGSPDQNVPPGGGLPAVPLTTGMSQTFTAGLTGQLTLVVVACQAAVVPMDAQPQPVPISITVGGKSATANCPAGAQVSVRPNAVISAQFVFASPPWVVKGHQYKITFDAKGNNVAMYAAADPYAGGAAAAAGGGPIDGVTDFAFATFVNTNATPPATGTDPSETPASGGSTRWLLPALLAFGLGAYAVLQRRKAWIREVSS